MFKPLFGVAVLLLTVAAAVNPMPERARDLVAHEWGTFTSVAGEDGRAVAWRPLDGAADLPCFVERATLPPKFSFRTTVRMETPVIYFYAPQPIAVDVSVGFRQGLITEFYPHAVSRTALWASDRLEWKGVRISPAAAPDFPVEDGPNHYYAARAAKAAPLQVGEQREGFLFYRGVGGFELPLRATVSATEEIHVVNQSRDAVPALMLFENRKGRIGFRSVGGLTETVTLHSPALDSDVATVRRTLERMLIDEGLYPREAAAMVETWSDSWFEEGTRLFYLVPRRLVDETLPLDIRPLPATVTRVFVGRLELATGATLDDVKSALLSADAARIRRFGRFLEPFSQRLFAKPMAASDASRIQTVIKEMGAYRPPARCFTSAP